MRPGSDLHCPELGVLPGPRQLPVDRSHFAPVDRGVGSPTHRAAQPNAVASPPLGRELRSQVAGLIEEQGLGSALHLPGCRMNRVLGLDHGDRRPCDGGEAGSRTTAASDAGKIKNFCALRHGGRLEFIPEAQVLEHTPLRPIRPLPDVVVATAVDQPVGRRWPAATGRSPQNQGPVAEQRREVQPVHVDLCDLVRLTTVDKRDRIATKVGGVLRVCVAEKVPASIHLRVGGQGRPLAVDLLADPLELGELIARRQVDVR